MAARLREQAAALERRADALREQRMELLRESWALGHEADELDRLAAEQAAGQPAPDRRETDAEFLDRIVAAMAEGEEWSSSELADRVDTSQTRMRAALARLEAIGVVIRSGLKRGTRYRLSDDESDTSPTPDNVRVFGNYETLVRDAAIKLDMFTADDVEAELPDLSRSTIARWLRSMEDAGMLAAERVGNAKLYAYIKPEGETPARPKHARPEDEARESDVARGGHAVAGTGRAERSGSSIVNQLIREVRPHGIVVTFSAHRVEFRRGANGPVIATASKTPGASSLKGTRGELRRAGVPV